MSFFLFQALAAMGVNVSWITFCGQDRWMALQKDYGISPFRGCHGANVQVLAFVFCIHVYYIDMIYYIS